MKKMRREILVTILVLCAATLTHGQVERVYRVAPAYNGRMDSLRIHVWPSQFRRLYNPLLVVVHGGAFMEGNYRDLDSTCKRYAQRGYTSVTVQYRLGFYAPWPLNPPYTYDRAEIVRACWRAMQDVRAAVRYAVDHAQEFSIDTNCITLGGVSAGSITALQSVIADASDSIPVEVFNIAPVQRGLESFQRPDLGPLDDASARPLPPISAMVNYYGAIMHPYMLDPAHFPSIVSYHQLDDPVVACGTAQALWGLPLGVSTNWPWLMGTCALMPLLEGGGHSASRRETMYYDGNAHDVHDQALVDTFMFEFLETHYCDHITSVDGSTIDPLTLDSLAIDQSWVAYDLMGRELFRGNSNTTVIRNILREKFTGIVIVVINNGQQTLLEVL